MNGTLEQWIRKYLDEWGRVEIRMVVDERNGKLHAYLHTPGKDCESLDLNVQGNQVSRWQEGEQ